MLFFVKLLPGRQSILFNTLNISKLNVDRCKILAPYDGKVMDVYTSIFTSIEERQPLMDIVGDGLLEAEIVVPSNWLKWLKKGHEVKITIDETGEVLDALNRPHPLGNSNLTPSISISLASGKSKAFLKDSTISNFSSSEEGRLISGVE